jgi:monofunctional biosynthetic peptidoglycan transglycosylase
MIDKNTLKKLEQWSAYLLLILFSISIAITIIYKWLPVPFTPLMILRMVEQGSDKKREIRLVKDWEPLKNIQTNLQLAVVCAEDQNFPLHHGFDFEAIEDALEHNKKYRRKRGASTISQQTAKNVFLYPARSWIRKGLEVYFTILIESFWTKERILEVYLNTIELGDGIYGAEAGSRYYFKKSASKLSPSQAAALAVVLPSPLRYRANHLGNYLQSRQNWVLRQMKQWDYRLDLTVSPSKLNK